MAVIMTVCLLSLNKFSGKYGNEKEIYNLICILLPINILFFTFMKERGIFCSWGMTRFGFIALQVRLAYYVLNNEKNEILKMLLRDILPGSLKIKTPIAEIPLIVFAIIFLFLCLHIFISKELV